MSGRYRWGFVAAFVVQLGLLGWIIADRAMLIANGAEIRLAVLPIDPRDLFLGDYVTLAYGISRIHSARTGGEHDIVYGETVYVTIEPDGDDWKAVSLDRTAPAGSTFLRGTVVRVSEVAAEPGDDCSETADICWAFDIDYNLERFYVPEGTGRELEDLRNGERISVDVAVADDGRAALKRLLVDGEIRYEETLL